MLKSILCFEDLYYSGYLQRVTVALTLSQAPEPLLPAPFKHALVTLTHNK
jgi:hypothetical protein